MGQEVLKEVLEPKLEFTLILRLTNLQRMMIQNLREIPQIAVRTIRASQIGDHPALIKLGYGTVV